MRGLAVKVGCCGFPVAKSRYYQSLDLVEVNSTFYTIPKIQLPERWRKEAPESFEFTVKAHKSISHIYKLEPTPECLESYRRMAEICKTLRSRLLLIQTPASVKPLDRTFLAAECFFKAVGGELTLLWETRGPEWLEGHACKRLGQLLRDYGVVHVTDPLIREPVYAGRMVYVRLHGLGSRLYYYQYSDEELKLLRRKIAKFARRGDVYVLFNNLSMFDDAIRFRTYLERDELPPLTGTYGVESFRKVFEKTRFPTTLAKLQRYLGWRLFDLEPDKQLPVYTILERITARSFQNLEELVRAAEKIIG
ncbi:MAG: DUF72 domain-containing protein [Candidatus Bathyarchaeia archaeon]